MPLPPPQDRYEALVEAGEILPDAQQRAAVQALDSLWRELRDGPEPNWWQRLTGREPPPSRGLYLWGSVGRGKTWLVDLFYESLPVRRKQRIHFHRFMQRVHHALRQLENTRDPLQRIAEDWSRECRVLCLDEFFVSDIADAMLLAGLLESLFARGVTLVTTSNLPPDDLYRDGLQRAKFLPAIGLIKRHTQVLHLAGDTDFRLRILEQSPVFHWPLGADADEALSHQFEQMAAGCELDADLKINDRVLQAERRGDGIIWFTFNELCNKPRGSVDYIELARAFNTVVISGIPQLGEEDSNAARRLIVLVDEFYDHGVKLLLSAAVPVETLYTGRRLRFEFQRTTSRLAEMQTHEYLARPHQP
ncbi:cell division protein ZapE [Elongatibacter sediminis]|uniref:Cell division protein ZapE n=1 Tax=Elongatibacter sediminis TaxID=3119006 RepID=A0AAW9RJA4_9GAMM